MLGHEPVSTPLEMRNHESGDRNEIHDWNQGALLDEAKKQDLALNLGSTGSYIFYWISFNSNRSKNSERALSLGLFKLIL